MRRVPLARRCGPTPSRAGLSLEALDEVERPGRASPSAISSRAYMQADTGTGMPRLRARRSSQRRARLAGNSLPGGKPAGSTVSRPGRRVSISRHSRVRASGSAGQGRWRRDGRRHGRHDGRAAMWEHAVASRLASRRSASPGCRSRRPSSEPNRPRPRSARSAPRRSTSRTAAGSIPRSSPTRTPRPRRSSSSATTTSASPATQKAEYNQYFSQAEPVTVKLDGKVYHIDPAPKDAAQ